MCNSYNNDDKDNDVDFNNNNYYYDNYNDAYISICIYI